MTNVPLAPLFQGFLVSFSVLVVIGAQNTFVLRQGIKRQHMFATASTSVLCDVLLIALGVGGLGTIITTSSTLTGIATWGGAIFLVCYGLRSFMSAFTTKPIANLEDNNQSIKLSATILSAMAFSLLNPYVYLDTVVMVGTIGARHVPIGRVLFTIGAIAASTTWFFGLAYGAQWMTPVFRNPFAWRVLDVVIGCITISLAISIAYH